MNLLAAPAHHSATTAGSAVGAGVVLLVAVVVLFLGFKFKKLHLMSVLTGLALGLFGAGTALGAITHDQVASLGDQVLNKMQTAAHK